MDNIDLEIKDELLKDRFNKFYHKKKIYILSIVFLILFVPIFIQIYFFYENKKNKNLLASYLKAEMMLNIDKITAINILKELKETNNETIVILSMNKLLDYYLLNNKKNEAINLLNNVQREIKNGYFIYFYVSILTHNLVCGENIWEFTNY